MKPAISALIAASLLAASCSNQDNASDQRGNANANARSSTSASNAAQFAVAEPERYRLLFELARQEPQSDATAAAPASNRNAASRHSGQSGAAGERIINPTEVSPNHFELDKVGGDRRWSFLLPGIGSVVYLEKSGLKYLVLYDRKQYLEVTPSDLGFDPGRSLNPVVAANTLSNRFESAGLGVEQVAARDAFKFRFTPRAGDPDGGRFTCSISVDQETRLPSRFELASTSTQDGRSILEARELKLNVSASLFDVPAGMRKIKAADAKQQIQSFAIGVQPFIEALNPLESHAKAATASGGSSTVSNANRTGRSTAGAAQANKAAPQSKNPRSRNGAILPK